MELARKVFTSVMVGAVWVVIGIHFVVNCQSSVVSCGFQFSVKQSAFVSFKWQLTTDN